MKKIKRKTKLLNEIKNYDNSDITEIIDSSKPLKLSEIGIQLPPTPPTQVISIRLPTELVNELRAIGSQQDVPYQILIKIMLKEGISRVKKRIV